MKQSQLNGPVITIRRGMGVDLEIVSDDAEGIKIVVSGLARLPDEVYRAIEDAYGEQAGFVFSALEDAGLKASMLRLLK